MNNNLRKGYTTGSCCAAGAGASLIKLLSGKNINEYEMTGPTGANILVPIKEISVIDERKSKTVVVKDGGDDPDITTGAEVVVLVSLVNDFSKYVMESREILSKDTGYFLSDRVYLKIGKGIGIVTKPGLACPEGKGAVNPVPRKMILNEVINQVEKYCYEGKIVVEVSIPEGVELSKNTFNPKLGIVGGISVLGTTGVVEPMSSQAILDTVKVEISVARALKQRDFLIITPGNYGMDFLKNEEFIKSLPQENVIKVSNFIGESTVLAAEAGFEHLIISGHLGKMIKVAGGMTNTHSKYGDNRVDTAILIIEELANEMVTKKMVANRWVCKKEELIGKIREAVMVDEILRWIVEFGGEELLEEFSKKVSEKVHQVLIDNLKKENEKYGKIKIDVMIFTNKFGLLFGGKFE